MTARALLWVAAACILLISGCAAPGLPMIVDPELGRLLIQTPPPDYSLEDRATGPMDFEAASVSTYGSRANTLKLLQTLNFRGGWSRVWTFGDAYISALVFDFKSQPNARTFVMRKLAEVNGASAIKYPLDQVPGGNAYVLPARSKTDGRTLYCQGSAFASGGRAFIINNCSTRAGDANGAVALAIDQYSRVK